MENNKKAKMYIRYKVPFSILNLPYWPVIHYATTFRDAKNITDQILSVEHIHIV